MTDSMWKQWRKDLDDVGGWENEMVSVPAGVVRKMIEAGEQQCAELEAVKSGASVVIPRSRVHATAMHMLAERYLQDNPSS